MPEALRRTGPVLYSQGLLLLLAWHPAPAWTHAPMLAGPLRGGYA
jgi:hypothetical protein